MYMRWKEEGLMYIYIYVEVRCFNFTWNWQWKSLAKGTTASDGDAKGGNQLPPCGVGRGWGSGGPRRAERLESEDGQAPAALTGLEAGYRFKAFSGDLGRVEGALERLESSGFYWAALSGSEAKERLSGQPVGTFLLRDSADPRHLFTLSVRTETGITNLRVCQRQAPAPGGGTFYLETEGGGTPASPSPEAVAYNCVVKLADYYVRLSGAGAALYRRRGRGQDPMPLLLRRPLLCKVPALQDLCRRALNLQLSSGDLEALPLPSSLREGLRD
ncbi:hypothetical protein scyTo_0002811 [Scyliorhinus torazame]|uniref:Suppressor of cytokine signaling 3 n=1 Tax=Scyliorhinus torazame TaxID=75743 RepID=A0A401PKS9_SCYTO|nr:hypothetical protein [Scyliorhinus torazame]